MCVHTQRKVRAGESYAVQVWLCAFDIFCVVSLAHVRQSESVRKKFIDCDRVCADFVKLDDAAPIHAPAYVSGGGGSVGMLRVMWPVSPVVLQSTKIHQRTILGSVLVLQVMWPRVQ